MSRDLIEAAGAPAAVGAYSHAVRTGNLVFLSGSIALDPASGEMVGGGDVAAEARQVLANMRAVLKAAGVDAAQVVKTTIFLVEMSDFAAVNAVYAEVFGASPPARTTVAVAGLPKGARVEIDAIAVVD
jgi:2-iminobutanoate/2-iminopropanoate deaminase